VKLSPASSSKWRERGGGLLFALLFNGLLLLALLTLAPKPIVQLPDFRNPVTFEMAPAPKAEKAQSKAEKSEKKKEKKQEKSERQPVQQVVKAPQPVVKPTEQQPTPFPFIQLNSQQMASADIGKLPKKSGEEGSAGQGNSAAVAGPGEGPGGVQLFDAEWYRRPTPAELAGYLPSSAPPNGWGLVACKTVDHYHVENCQALGESPQGSGFAKAVRLAAWQFLVLPPRVNGKVMVGSWVRIRIDYTRTVVGSDQSGR
jgi:protein TonB